MKIGLQVPSFTFPGGERELAPTLARIAQTVDEAGFASLWVMDHFFQIQSVGQFDEPMLEGYSALNYMAGLTRRVRLGTMVTGVVYRHPGILVKQVTTLDVLSGGRAYMGIGAAWNEREARGLGIPFPPLKERFERLEEALQIAHLMWSDNPQPFAGKHYQLAEPVNRPQPITRPHPPILIGGMGENKTLRLVAQYADATNMFAFSGIDVIRAKLDVLRRQCDAVGRPYDQIEKTVLGSADLSSGSAAFIATLREYAKLGVQHYIFNLPNAYEIKPLELVGREVIPAAANL